MDNADLEKLRVSPGKLTPKFSPSVTSYAVTMGSSVSEVKLTVLTSDSGASYIIKGTDKGGKVARVQEGETLDLDIVVSAEDGSTTKTYSIRLRRLSADDATLSELKLSVGTLLPTFDPLHTFYKCCLPCNVDSVSLSTKTEEEAMKVAMRDGSPVDTLRLNPGRTLATITVTAASGDNSAEYTIIFEKSDLPPTLRLKKKKCGEFECAVCCCLVNKATRIDQSPYLYCQDCLEEITRTNKTDPFNGRSLEEEEWMVTDFEQDAKLGAEEGVCPLPNGPAEGHISQMGRLLEEAGKKIAEMPTEGCKECSKKVPLPEMALHKELLCTAKHPIQLEKQPVTARVWEKRLVTVGSDAGSLVKTGKELEQKYISSLPHPGENIRYEEGQSPVDYLVKAARAYATALSHTPKDGRTHLALGLVLEELFYVKDLFGMTQEEPLGGGEEGEAEASSKEEEFLAICKLHGVLSSAPMALQLKAVDSEYQGLKELGQTHKADHVQTLYAWKSKKILEASQGSYALEKEGPLYKARLKYQDAVSLDPLDGEACYHLGRLCLLLGERDTAREHLMAAVALKPTLSPARFCLGLVLDPASSSSSVSSSASLHTKTLLVQGLSRYLKEMRLLNQNNPEPYRAKLQELHVNKFYHTTNTLITDGFLHLASLSGHAHLTTLSCLLCVTSCVAKAHLHHRASTYERLLWSSLKARSVLLTQLHKDGDPVALRHCRQLSALINCSGLEATTPAVREMQMEVFQLGVVMQPSSSEALCHLGNGQLTQYDATGKEHWLTDAELSFRASIEMEGKVIDVSVVPGKLKEQEWWKNKEGKVQGKPSAASPSSSTPSKGASSVPAGKKPPSTGSTAGAGRVQPSGGSRQSGPGSSRQQQQPTAAGRGKGAAGSTRTQPGGGSAARTQPGGARTQPGGTRTQAGAGGRAGGTTGPRAGAGGGGGGAAVKKPSVGGGATAASKPGPASRQQGNARGSTTTTTAGKTPATTGKTVATLGDLKAGANPSKANTSAGQSQKPATATTNTASSSNTSAGESPVSSPSKEPAKLTEKNQPSYHPRLGLARTLVKTEQEDSLKEARVLYEEVMTMSPSLHDAYIELGDMLQKKDSKAAVEVYARFPFQDPPTFDDAFLHGEIIRLVMKSEDYDNPYLASSMIAMGKALGIGVLEKQVSILENKFKSPLLKSVYAGVHGKPVDDPELQAFFKFKCWL